MKQKVWGISYAELRAKFVFVIVLPVIIQFIRMIFSKII